MREAKLREYVEKGHNILEIAEKMNISRNTVQRELSRLSLKTKTGSQGARKHAFDESYFENVDSPEKAYWLGFIAADGCVYRGSDKYSSRLQINLKGSDVAHLQKFQRAIGSNYKVAERETAGSAVCQLKVNSTKMCEDLRRLGIVERKSLVVEMPNLEATLIRDFIRGYYDGDGWISTCTDKNGRFRWKFGIVGGKEMLDSINAIMPCGLETYKIKAKSEIYTIETTQKQKLIKIYDFLYEGAETFLDRKQETFESLLSRFAEM